ncbi:MAG: endolytic transglycosylase MltG [Lysobacteraceae bacterium]
MTDTARPKRRRLRWLLWLLPLLLLALAAAAYGVWTDYQRFLATPLSIGAQEQVFEVKRGDSFRHVLRRLRRAGIDEGHDLYWEALAFDLGVLTRLQVGEYALGHGLTPSALLRKLESGQVIQHRFTLVEGWSMRDLRLALARDASLAQTLEGLSNEELMKRLGRDGVHPEGRFLPETYLFTRGVSDFELLRRALIAMDKALLEAWEGRQDDLPLASPDELLTLASIIEKETGRAEERPDIAGVFARRMRIGMRLQTDPTVIYGLGEAFNGNLTRAHLRADTPWNTYTRGGLPPTPIAMPGKAALQAAAHPAEGDTLYFVSRGDGSHQFSRTLDEHNAAVRRYQLRRR